MGIENFFNTLTKTKICSQTSTKLNDIKCNYLYIDFNSIIYSVSELVEYDLNYYLYSIIINDKDDKCISIEDTYNVCFTTTQEFNDYFTQNKVDNIVKTNIYEHIKNLVKTLNNNESLQEIFISFDGLPTMSKIVEQRKRKYTSYMISCFKEHIYKKYSNTISDNKKNFYNNMVSFNKRKSLFNTIYDNYQDIYNNIDSFDYKNELKNMCKNLKSVIISSDYEFGEGEKKIMEDIMNNKKEGSYVIVSPDSDIVLLSLMIQNKLIKEKINNTFSIVRYNKNNSETEVIKIDDLRNNILNIVFNKLSEYRKQNYKDINIIDDIISLFVFFGNDFIPKLESLNNKISINVLIDIYVKNFNYSRLHNPYLIYDDKNITKVNQEVFYKLIEKIAEVEDKLIFDKHIITEYKNYNYLANIFESNQYTPFFIDKLNRYCHGFNKVIRHLRSNNFDINDTYTQVINNFSDKTEWEEAFLKIESRDINESNITTHRLLEIISNNIKNNNFRCGLKLLYYTNNVSDNFHQTIMKNELEHPKMEISKYDIEVYKLERKMDEYAHISQENDLKLGKTELKYKDCEYKIYTDKDIQSKKNYYYKHIMKCNIDEIDNISKEYIKGFFWTIDFYFNKINRKQNINYISTWSYKYSHSPYINEIKSYMDKIRNRNYELNKLFLTINDIHSIYYVNSSQFMNKIEQYIFTTPKKLLSTIPNNYKSLISDENICPDIDDIVERILNGERHLIDTYDIKFLNRANISFIKSCDYYYYTEKAIKARNKIDSVKNIFMILETC